MRSNFNACRERAISLGFTEYLSSAGWYPIKSMPSFYSGYQYYIDVNADHPAIVCDDDKRGLVGVARWPIRRGVTEGTLG